MDALSRVRRAIVVALCAATAIAVLGPELVRHTVGGDCRVFWQLAGAAARVDPSGNLVIDTGPCPLSGGQTVAVWIAAVAIALIAGVTTMRLSGGRD
jgi:hypothetical protein